MTLALGLCLTVSLLAALSARWLAEWLPPRTATWLLAGGAVALAGTSGAMLGLVVLAAAVRTSRVAALGHMSLPTMIKDDPTPGPAGVAAGVLLAAAALAAAWVGFRRARALIATHRLARHLPGSAQVVVIADEAADAYAAPGWPGRIVVTSGMMLALGVDERRVLLAHERAHVTGHHYLFTAAARLAAAANPLLRPVNAAVRYSIERWADEEAAAATGDRSVAAHAVARAALAAAAAPAQRPSPALGVVTTADRMREAGAVPRRVAALLRPPPRGRQMLLAVAIALVSVCGIAALDAALNLHALIEFAQAVLSRRVPIPRIRV
ncbi:MAG TPA: M48 family metalloprotease [Streptosporangiaceae bacterium]|jgi:Zn-dependent protease with chaperone function|nr:M48 family metalloprotease [Streptosporangiaceae bacterium]